MANITSNTGGEKAWYDEFIERMCLYQNVLSEPGHSVSYKIACATTTQIIMRILISLLLGIL